MPQIIELLEKILKELHCVHYELELTRYALRRAVPGTPDKRPNGEITQLSPPECQFTS